MKDISEIKAEIRRMTAEKIKKKSAARKLWIALLVSLPVCICISVFVLSHKKENTVYFSQDGAKIYNSLDEIVDDSDIVFVGTVMGEILLSDDTSKPENMMTKYIFSVERRIIGSVDETAEVVTVGGTVGGVDFVPFGSEKYVVGEKYMVFLKNYGSAVSCLDEYRCITAETSFVQGKIHIVSGRPDTDTSPWKNVGGLSSIQNEEELYGIVEKIKSNN